MEDLVRLKCFEDNNKLRVRIISPGYKNEANCQFPKNIRVKDREYLVPANVIRLRKFQMKWFYSIPKNSIKIVHEIADYSKIKVFGDSEGDFEGDSEGECCICFATPKDSIFAPCGHYACCNTCSTQLMNTSNRCPICRAQINAIIAYIDLS